MSFKRILLPVNDQDDISLIADFAFTLAERHQSQVQGIFPQQDVNRNFWLDNYGLNESEIEEVESQRKKKAAEVARGAKKRFEVYAKKHEAIDAKHVWTFGDIATALLDHVFFSDVIVLGNTTHQGSRYWRSLADDLLVQSTKPVIICPSRPVSGKLGDRIVIAWKHSPEASRAIAAAMPLIEKAKQVVIVSVGESEDLKAAEQLENYLLLHAKNVDVKLVAPKNGNTGSLLVKETATLPGSIMIMGAFSHPRWQERAFGGVTEYILHNTDVPVLMMH